MPQAPLYSPPTPDTARGLMADLWRGSLQDYVSNDPAYGTRIKDDFVQPRLNATSASANKDWWLQITGGSTAQAFTSVDGDPDGSVLLSATPTTSGDDGATAHFGDEAATGNRVNLPTHATAPRGRVVYQTRATRSHGTVRIYFAGLAPAAAAVLAAGGALPDSAYLGFRIDLSGNLDFVTKSAATGSGGVSDSVRVLNVADFPTGVSILGFAVNKDRSVDIVVNNQIFMVAARSINPLALPVVSLAPAYSVDSDAAEAVATTWVVDDIDVFVSAL